MTVYFTMKKLFLIKWTDEVVCKFLLINVKLLDILLHHIMNGTLNPKLIANDCLSMNNTTLQVLARDTSRFNIRTGIDKSLTDTTLWTYQKKKRCFNCNVICCNMCSCSQPIYEAEYNRNKAVYIKAIGLRIRPSLMVPYNEPIGVSSGNRAGDINRHKTTWLKSKDKAAWFEAKKDNILTQHDYRQERYKWCFPSEEEHGKRIIHGIPYTWKSQLLMLLPLLVPYLLVPLPLLTLLLLGKNCRSSSGYCLYCGQGYQAPNYNQW